MYAFVTFDHEDDAEYAVKKMNGQMFDGREFGMWKDYSHVRNDCELGRMHELSSIHDSCVLLSYAKMYAGIRASS